MSIIFYSHWIRFYLLKVALIYIINLNCDISVSGYTNHSACTLPTVDINIYWCEISNIYIIMCVLHRDKAAYHNSLVWTTISTLSLLYLQEVLVIIVFRGYDFTVIVYVAVVWQCFIAVQIKCMVPYWYMVWLFNNIIK
jgi:hypothetical protein